MNLKKILLLILSVIGPTVAYSHDLRPENTLVIPLEINRTSLTPVIDKLASIENESVVNILIDTYGGESGVTGEFTAIVRQMKASGVTVNCYIYKAISAGFDIFLSCSNRYVFPKVIILQHEARIPGTAFSRMTNDGLIDQDTLLELYNDLSETNKERFQEMVKLLPKQDKKDMYSVFKASRPFKKEYLNDLRESGYIQNVREEDVPGLLSATKSARVTKPSKDRPLFGGVPTPENQKNPAYMKEMGVCLDSVAAQLFADPQLFVRLMEQAGGSEEVAADIVISFCDDQVKKVLNIK